MTLTIELTPEQEMRLRAEAKREGKEPIEVLTALLDTLPAEASEEREPTWGERVAAELKAEGVIGMWADRTEDTLDLARQLRTQAETRGETR